MSKLLKYLKPYWFKVSIIFVLVSLVAVGTLLLPDYMSDIIAEGISSEFQELNPNTGLFEVVESCDIEANPETCIVNQQSDFKVIIKYGSYMLGVTLVSSLAFIALMYLSSDVGAQFGRDIRRDYYKKITSVSVYETDKFGTFNVDYKSFK